MRFTSNLTPAIWITAFLLLFAAPSAGGKEVYRPDKNPTAISGFPGDVLQTRIQQLFSPYQADNTDTPTQDDGQKSDTDDDEYEDDEWEA